MGLFSSGIGKKILSTISRRGAEPFRFRFSLPSLVPRMGDTFRILCRGHHVCERKFGWNVPRLGWVKDCTGASPIMQSDIPTVVDTPPLDCLKENV